MKISVRAVSLAVSLCLAFAALQLSAATFVVPNDRELVRRSEAIVNGVVSRSFVERDARGGIYTITEVQVRESIKGQASGVVRVRTIGGAVDGLALVVPGAPQFAPGDDVLLFLNRSENRAFAARDEWETTDLVVGKFRRAIATDGQEVLVREEEEIFGWNQDGMPHKEKIRLAKPFLDYVRGVVAGRRLDAAESTSYFAGESTLVPAAATDGHLGDVTANITNPNASDYAMQLTIDPNTRPARWSTFPTALSFRNWNTLPQAPNGGLDAINSGLAWWTDDPQSNLAATLAGTTGTQQCLNTSDSIHGISFNDPCSEITGTFNGSGVLARGGFWINGFTHVHSGVTYWDIFEANLVVQNGVGENWTGVNNANSMATLLAHELGHTFSFRHANTTAAGGACNSNVNDCVSGAAVMNSSLVTFSGLQAWDQRAVRALYPGPACEYSLTASSASPSASGGASTVGVTTTSGCAWTAVSNAAWITVDSGTPGNGSGTVGYTVAANTGPARSGTMTIAGHTFTVNQANGCSYLLGAPSVNVAAIASTGNTVSVTSGTGCAWTAVSNNGFITVTGGAAGSGNGTVTFSVSANAGLARSGTITIAGQTFTVNQATGICDVELASSSLTMVRDGVSNTVAFTTVCSWSATSNAGWLTVNSPNGTGSGNLQFTVSANTTPWRRIGVITIGDQQLTVTQLGTSLRGDFNGDGRPDLLFREATSGENMIHLQNGLVFIDDVALPTEADLNWKIIGAGDFNADGAQDIVWRNTSTGANRVWYMRGTEYTGSAALATVPTTWQLASVFKYDNVGSADLFWRNTTNGSNVMWFMTGTSLTSTTTMPTVANPWTVQGMGDFNNDGWQDILWRNASTGQIVIWFLQSTTLTTSTGPGYMVNANVVVAAIGDYNFDGWQDVLFQDITTGDLTLWRLGSGVFLGTSPMTGAGTSGWRVAGPR